MTDGENKPSPLPTSGSRRGPVTSLAVSGPLRIDVVAGTVVDVVASVGGWLANRARAGWAVCVYLDERNDTGALDILGVQVRALPAFAEVPCPGLGPHVLAAAGDVIVKDSRVRADVLRALTHSQGRVVTWGESSLPYAGCRVDTFEYQLDAAATAFKTYALRAASTDAQAMARTERFRGRMGALGPRDWDLTAITFPSGGGLRISSGPAIDRSRAQRQ